MPKSSRQKQKILYLAKFFLEETDEDHPATMSDILAYLSRAGIDAERKSIYSDLEELSLFGLDTVTLRGRGGGYFLGERAFQLPEVRLLVDAVQSSRFLTRKKSEELIKKLRSLTSRHQSSALSHTVSVSGRIKTMNESIYRNVDAIGAAIEAGCKIRFRYFEWSPDGEKRLRREGAYYTASPFFLIWDNENYYLIAVEEQSGEKRHFRVDKMLNIEETDSPREGKELLGEVSPADYETRSFGMYGGAEERVTLWWSDSLSGVFYDRFGKDVAVRKDKDGFISSHRLMVSPVFYSFLMGFGGNVKILSPQWVREEFCDLARKSLAPYESEESL
ncbi:MAG: WYL domain-containing protein [Clostridia bacterium]|nr:WYL domain-containing protein [Clostridia bacterium]